jgi:4-hydroxy-4-methyl-2-oxoglutarate aldolase
MDQGIRPLWTGARISAEPAATATTGAGDVGSLAAAIAAAQPGDVLAVDGNGHTGRALWTVVDTLAAIRRGVVGLVLDGLVRDFGRLRGRPTYCGGLLSSPTRTASSPTTPRP